MFLNRAERRKRMKPDTARLKKLLEATTKESWITSPYTTVLGIGIVAQPSGNVITLGVTSESDSEFMVEAHNQMANLLAYIEELEGKQSGNQN